MRPPRFVAFAGGSFQNSRFLSGDRSNLWGAEASFEGWHFYPHMTLVADGALHYGWNQFPISCVTVGIVCTPNPPDSRAKQYDFLGGPQYRFFSPDKKIQPFVHAFGGYGRATMQTNGFFAGSWAWEVAGGGGIEYTWRGPFAFRGSADYLRTNFFNDSQNDVRGSLGIVWRF